MEIECVQEGGNWRMGCCGLLHGYYEVSIIGFSSPVRNGVLLGAAEPFDSTASNHPSGIF